MSTNTTFWMPRVELPLEFMKMLSVFTAATEHYGLTVRCVHCEEKPIGDNDITAPLLTMKCTCRTFIGVNPKQRLL